MARFPLRTPAFVRFLATLALTFGVSRANAQPTLGFVEDFPVVNGTGSWAGGSLYDNPGTGGYGGVGDGFLDVRTPSPDRLGAVSFAPEYAGNWSAAGITQVRCWMTDLSGNGDLSIHLSLSNGFSTWQQNAGFVPPVGSWGEYVVNLTAADFKRIRGTTGTFAGILTSADRLHFRHDLPPFNPTPALIVGEFGLDHISLLAGSSTGVPLGGFGSQPVLLEPPYPNPARGRVTFTLRQPEAKPVHLTILDAAGRRVRDVSLTAGGSAPRVWMWDGRDDQGLAAPAGVYHVLARGANGGMSRTVTLLR